MSTLHAFILGMVQGLGEFLPISSSAHLILTPWLFKWDDPGLGFDVALHWGTLLAVLVYFRTDVRDLIRGFWHTLFAGTRDFTNIYQKLSWLLIIASVPGAIVGKLLESKAETAFRNPVLVAVNLAVFGGIILAADYLGKKIKNLDRITPSNAFVVGCAQALAVIPGISRSGASIAAGLSMGFKREDATRFSFLMSIPIIFGAGLLKLKDFHTGVTSIQLIVGFVTAAVFGFFSIKYMIRYISKHNFNIFVWYRFALAALVLVIYFIRK